MYTGITRGTFPIADVKRTPGLLTYRVVLSPELVEGLEPGASVSIDGVCQTVVKLEDQTVTFDAIQETLDRTTLSELAAGGRVSVERSYRIGDELGGHEVSGHVHGTGTITEVRDEDGRYEMRIGIPKAWLRYVLEKGFIAVDGSSLTVGKVDASQPEQGAFWLHLIPETLRLTRLGNKRVGDRVNIELDARTVAIVDTVERVLAAKGHVASSDS
ncbi:MAG: riboflavin synthase subunit alpha [Myxococcales bacterium]|nr:riboflavin synthase subunit alpha [Myxococcales bacterium]